ncbi:hypothetical protein VNO77_21498 [Canavalia gladiata]|uniref:Uncharacterized protein n=1 Tax=Canavalia gladiata TaxID=3824 RepID=A0AAN9LR66_CANGL
MRMEIEPAITVLGRSSVRYKFKEFQVSILTHTHTTKCNKQNKEKEHISTQKMSKESMSANSKKKVSCRRLGGYLKEQKGRLYIIRRCVVMLLCWHD